jgi:cytochrome c oxidase subunit II
MPRPAPTTDDLGRSTAPRRGSIRRLLAALPLLAFTACRFGAPPGSNTQGQHISNLYQLLFYAAIPIAVIVYGLILFSIVRWRRRRGDPDRMPPQFRYHIPLELSYVAIPLLLVAGLFVAIYNTEKHIDAVSANPDLRVDVTAFQWQWRFAYPQYGIDIVGTPARNPTLVVPADSTVQIRLFSADVAHAFYVPDFLFKRDAIPGHPNVFDFTDIHPGTYRGECAEFCGLDHAYMNFTLRALPPAQFQTWVQQHRRGST